MTFTMSYIRETAIVVPTFVNEKETARYVMNYTNLGNKNRRAYYLCGQDSRDDELKYLLALVATDVSDCLGVPVSKVKCGYGNGGIVVTVEETK